MHQSKLDEEIERRENERFKALESHNEERKKNFNVAEKKEFDRLWSFYCNNLDKICDRTHQITEIRIEEITLAKELKSKIYVFFLIVFAAYITEYFLNTENNSLPIAIFALAAYFFYILIRKEIKVAIKNIEEKIHSSVISEIRHTLSLNSMPLIKYEREYIEAFNKLLHGGSAEKEKEKENANHEKYTNLHFTYASDALIKLTKKNLEC
jgi:hypothetical protein